MRVGVLGVLGVLGDSGIDVRLNDVLGDCMVVSSVT